MALFVPQWPSADDKQDGNNGGDVGNDGGANDCSAHKPENNAPSSTDVNESSLSDDSPNIGMAMDSPSSIVASSAIELTHESLTGSINVTESTSLEDKGGAACEELSDDQHNEKGEDDADRVGYGRIMPS